MSDVGCRVRCRNTPIGLILLAPLVTSALALTPTTGADVIPVGIQTANDDAGCDPVCDGRPCETLCPEGTVAHGFCALQTADSGCGCYACCFWRL